MAATSRPSANRATGAQARITGTGHAPAARSRTPVRCAVTPCSSRSRTGPNRASQDHSREASSTSSTRKESPRRPGEQARADRPGPAAASRRRSVSTRWIWGAHVDQSAGSAYAPRRDGPVRRRGHADLASPWREASPHSKRGSRRRESRAIGSDSLVWSPDASVSSSRSPSTAQSPSGSPVLVRGLGYVVPPPRRASRPGTSSTVAAAGKPGLMRSHASTPPAWDRGCSSSESPRARSSRTGSTSTSASAPARGRRSAWPRSRPNAHGCSRSAQPRRLLEPTRRTSRASYAGRRGQRVLPRLSLRERVCARRCSARPAYERSRRYRVGSEPVRCSRPYRPDSFRRMGHLSDSHTTVETRWSRVLGTLVTRYTFAMPTASVLTQTQAFGKPIATTTTCTSTSRLPSGRVDHGILLGRTTSLNYDVAGRITRHSIGSRKRHHGLLRHDEYEPMFGHEERLSIMTMAGRPSLNFDTEGVAKEIVYPGVDDPTAVQR